MKTYRFDIKVTGFVTVEVKAGSKKKAEEKALDAVTLGDIVYEDLQCVSLDLNLLDVDGKETR